MAAPTVDDLKQHARLNTLSATASGFDDPLLQRYLDAALEYVERRCGSLADGEVTVQVRESNPRHPYLPLPLTRVGTVVTVTNPTGTVVEVDVELTNLEAGLVYTRQPARGTWTVKVTRPAAAASQELHLAVLIIADHLLQAARGPRNSQDPYDVPDFSAGFAVPRRATELMADWLVPGFA